MSILGLYCQEEEKVKKLGLLSHAESVIENACFLITFTGSGVHVFKKPEYNEAACFSGMKYVYDGVISPDGKILAVKSRAGWLYFYSLETLTLMKQISLDKKAQGHDGGYCFSGDNKYLYNIMLGWNFCTTVHKYDVSTFAIADTFFKDKQYTLHDIGYVPSKKLFWLCGYEYIGEFHKEYKNIIMWFDGKNIVDIVYVEFEMHRAEFNEKESCFVFSNFNGQENICNEKGEIMIL